MTPCRSLGVALCLLTLVACDSGGIELPVDEPPVQEGGPLGTSFGLVGVVGDDAAAGASANGIVPIQSLTTCELNSQSPGEVTRRVIVEGSVQFDASGDFGLSIVHRSYEDAAAPKDTVRVIGSSARSGPLTLMAPSGGGRWFASVGPDVSSPTTVTLQVGRETVGDWVLRGCEELVFARSLAVASLKVEGGTVAEPQAWRATKSSLGNGYFGSFGAYATDSAHVDLRPDGTFSYNLWYRSGPCGRCTDTPNLYVLEGAYVREGDVHLLEPDSHRRTYALLLGDSLTVFGAPWNSGGLLVGQPLTLRPR